MIAKRFDYVNADCDRKVHYVRGKRVAHCQIPSPLLLNCFSTVFQLLSAAKGTPGWYFRHTILSTMLV